MPQFFDLTGHVAIVTGGNAGLGLGMARGLAKAGANVAVWGRSEERNGEAAGELRALGVQAEGFACDVTDPKAVATSIAATVERFGRIDSCFANAGGSGARKPFTDMTPEDWNFALDLNLNSVVHSFRSASKQMIAQGTGGKLVVTSSIAALLGLPGGPYSATKAAVTGLARSLGVELAPAGIQCNAVLPGFIETEMSLNTPQAFQDACLRRTPSGKLGTLEDMEGIAVFLASQQSNLITGQTIVIDGGQSVFPF